MSENSNKNNSCGTAVGGERKFVLSRDNEKQGLNVHESGWQRCDKGHSWGPGWRPNYVMHYVTSGDGIFMDEGKTYALSKGDIFLIEPGRRVYYKADEKNPWNYFWVIFSGTETKRLLKSAGFLGGVYTMQAQNPDKVEAVMREINSYEELSDATDYGMLGHFYVLLSELMRGKTPAPTDTKEEIYIKRAKRFIDENFAEKIMVREVAYFVGLERSYFYKLFKQQTGVSPQEYLLTVRLLRAKELMREGEMTLSEIAYAVGYENYIGFSRAFKGREGLSPSEFMQKK